MPQENKFEANLVDPSEDDGGSKWLTRPRTGDGLCGGAEEEASRRAEAIRDGDGPNW